MLRVKLKISVSNLEIGLSFRGFIVILLGNFRIWKDVGFFKVDLFRFRFDFWVKRLVKEDCRDVNEFFFNVWLVSIGRILNLILVKLDVFGWCRDRIVICF